MSEAIAFDTHRFVKHLTESGFTERQAEALANEQINLLNSNLATKADIEVLRGETRTEVASIRKEIEVLRQETKTGIEVLRQETKAEVASIRKEIEVLRQEFKTDIEVLRQEFDRRVHPEGNRSPQAGIQDRKEIASKSSEGKSGPRSRPSGRKSKSSGRKPRPGLPRSNPIC